MSHKIRIWTVGDADNLHELSSTQLDFESRLEVWLERDISILGDDLVVIGRQVETDFGGYIDLLCIDDNGDVVIVELKRDKTPRDIIAQSLEYASWVDKLSGADLTRIAGCHLSSQEGLENAFRSRFHCDLPDAINENHRILIVAAEVDSRTERVVKYLSDRHGVNINVALFQHFGDVVSGEHFARVYLFEPEQVEYNTRSHGNSKRRPNLTHEELERLAEVRGVGSLYRDLAEKLGQLLSGSTTLSSISYKAMLPIGTISYKREDRQSEESTNGQPTKSRRAIINLLPGESSADKGVRFQVYSKRLEVLTGRSQDEVVQSLPSNREPWSFGSALEDWSGFQGFFANAQEIERFAALLQTTGIE